MKLNLGCGPHAMHGWVNIDLEARPGVRGVDLRDPVFFNNEIAEIIFTEHFIEHLTQQEGQQFLKGCAKSLKPGGIIRVSCPDLDYLVDCYKVGRLKEWSPTWEPKSKCEMMNQGMREWGHQYLYNYEELSRALFAAGFASVHRVKWHESECPELCNLEVRPYVGDLIVEAVKW